MRFKSLGSGSTGNATLVQSTGVGKCNVLIDCGFGLKQLLLRLEKSGVCPEDLDAIFITHEHGDHIGCAQVLASKYSIPVWMSAGTAQATGFADASDWLRVAMDAVPIDLGSIQLMPFTVPHDAQAPLQLTCSDGTSKLGVLTDLGHATDYVLEQMSGCTAVLLECNHNTELLAASAYPAFLKQRISGGYGHLSNAQSAAVAFAIKHSKLKHVVAAHLSLQNNSPDLVRYSLSQAMCCDPKEIAIATPSDGFAWLDA